MTGVTADQSAEAARGSSARVLPVGASASSLIPWLLAAVMLSALSLLHSSMPTGFDPSAWVTWARSAGRGQFITFAIEPGWKPLPVIVMTPAAAMSGHLAGALWLVIVRSCALLTPVLAFRLIRPAFGARAAAISAAAVAAVPGLWVTALNGHSEPVAVVAALAATECLKRSRPRAAIVLITVAALMRPEAILLLGAVAVFAAVRREWGLVGLVAACAATFAACWYGMPWLLADDPWQVHRLSPITPPFRSEFSTVEKLTMPLSSGIWPIRFIGIGFAVLGALAVVRSRDGVLRLLMFAAACFTAIEVAVLLAGAAGAPRYFLPATVIGSALVGPGADVIIRRLRSNAVRNAAAAAAVFALAVTGPLPPSSPLRNRALVIPSATASESLDRAADLMASSRVLEREPSCRPIGLSYGLWPIIAARSGQPMATFDYRVPAAAITLEHLDATGKPDPDQLIIRGERGDREVLAQSMDPSGGGRWVIARRAGASPCG